MRSITCVYSAALLLLRLLPHLLWDHGVQHDPSRVGCWRWDAAMTLGPIVRVRTLFVSVLLNAKATVRLTKQRSHRFY
jgi:hypothetical protein